ncbi:hypothetical protein [Labrys monachus]|uniref:Uncharacterized protein n=1 Tax=Labrys monachus TaxID=217067 RepID=A0ABU0F825_9HYPH|nr:hypothetical protein [Labrys monachus]MDQ0390761.1 hypothetical protein [Labrys monachus]
MEHASLVAFLKGDLTPEAFGREIEAEVHACDQGCKSEGVGYIIITDGPAEVVTRDHARRLLQALLVNRLSFLAANYTAECLIMSDDFEFADAAVTAAIALVADDSRSPTSEETEVALAALD